MILQVDYRVGSREFLEPLRRSGIRAVLSHKMRYGDFWFQGHGPRGPSTAIGIERKTLQEMIAAIIDDRFVVRQLPGMLRTYDLAWLVVEGAYRSSPRGELQASKPLYRFSATPLLYATLEKFIIGLASHTAIRIKVTSSPAQTVAFLRALTQYHEKPWEAHRSIRGPLHPLGAP